MPEEKVLITARGELLSVNLPSGGQNHIVSVILQRDEILVSLDGISVDKETGDLVDFSPDGIVAAADDLAKACAEGTIDSIRKARKIYMRLRGTAQYSAQEPSIPEPVEITPHPDLIPSEAELEEMNRCICPQPGCPVHETEDPEKED
jgi:hypothetical protein